MMTMVKKELGRLTNEATGEPFTDDEINGGGLRVTTTFTEKAMDAAEEGYLEARPEGFSDKQLHVGVASVEVGTGAVRGFYAGQDYLQSQLNWAVSGGQAGSSLKPFALSAGIRQGFSLKDTFDGNSPIEVGDTLEFENQGDEDFGSSVNLIKATQDSINTAFIDLTESMDNGPEAVVKQANLMGIPPELPKSGEAKDPGFGFPNNTPGLEPGVGVALGSATVSPINMANGYATIANGGRAVGAVHHRAGHRRRRRGALLPLGLRQDGHERGHRRGRLVRPAAGRDARGDRAQRPRARPRVRRQDGHVDQHRRRRRVGLVHRLHPADGDLGRLPPRQRRRQARRLAAVVLRR